MRKMDEHTLRVEAICTGHKTIMYGGNTLATINTYEYLVGSKKFVVQAFVKNERVYDSKGERTYFMVNPSDPADFIRVGSENEGARTARIKKSRKFLTVFWIILLAPLIFILAFLFLTGILSLF